MPPAYNHLISVGYLSALLYWSFDSLSNPAAVSKGIISDPPVLLSIKAVLPEPGRKMPVAFCQSGREGSHCGIIRQNVPCLT